MPKAIACSKGATLPPLSLSRQDVDFQQGSHFAVQKNISWLQISVSYRNIDAPVKILDRASDVDGDTQLMMEMKK